MPNVCWIPGVRVKGSVFKSRIGGRVELPLPLLVCSEAPLPRGEIFSSLGLDLWWLLYIVNPLLLLFLVRICPLFVQPHVLSTLH